MTFEDILGNYLDVERVRNDIMVTFGREKFSGELLLAFSLVQAFEKIEALEGRVQELEKNRNG